MSYNTSVDIYTTPAGLPPPGVVPNLVHPLYLHTLSQFTLVLCLAVSTIAVALRIFTKVYLMRKFRGEDCTLYPRPPLSTELLICSRRIDSSTSIDPTQSIFQAIATEHSSWDSFHGLPLTSPLLATAITIGTYPSTLASNSQRFVRLPTRTG